MTIQVLETLGIFSLTLFLILRKPFGLHEAWGTVIGSVLMLVFGLVSFSQSCQTVLEGASVLLFLLALMVLSALLDLAGFFEWAAILAARACDGNGQKLYRNVFLLGAVTTAVLSLDTTAIILTPIVVAFVQRLNLKAYPFLIACAFVANTGSLLFPVSNLTNLLFQEAFHYSFFSFTLFMLVPQLVALALNYWLFKFLFRSSIPKTFDKSLLPDALSAVPDRLFFNGAVLIVAVVIVGYFVASLYRIHPVFVASIGAGFLLVWGAWRRQLDHRIWKDISWSLFPFVIGLFIVIRGVENIGLSNIAANMFVMADKQPLIQVPVIACATALGSNLINNIPMALLAISALKHAHSNLLDQYSALLGCNLGPNLTIAGSLATMLVITSARKRGENISAMDFLRIGLVATPVLVIGASIAAYCVGCLHID
ncbi:MAG: ArsB/NhaD family transporter [Candidatus Obscuribacterales bacterium]|nr:ArsB/NhaD family transporter [Candidatus Obscuribacterales bacterium]